VAAPGASASNHIHSSGVFASPVDTQASLTPGIVRSCGLISHSCTSFSSMGESPLPVSVYSDYPTYQPSKDNTRADLLRKP
jgi:hypothetical protein